MVRKMSPDEQARRALFARTMRESIVASGMTLEQISRRLGAAGTPASAATLSYWQNGHSAPTRGRSLEVVKVLEDILQLARGTLTRLLARPDLQEWSPPTEAFGRADLEERLRSWGMTSTALQSHKLLQQKWILSADRRGVVERSRTISQIEAESQSGFPVILRDEGSGHLPTVRFLHGCRMGRQVVGEPEPILITEAVLPRRLTRGEYHWSEIEIEWQESAQPRRSVASHIGRLVPLLTLDVTFRGEPPREVIVGCDPIDGSPATSRPLEVRGQSVQTVVENAAPGMHWLAWEVD